jgi:hypothetical protein
MPTINYTHTVVDDASVDADEISKSIYNHDNTTGDSLAVYNGGIDKDNLDSSFQVTRDIVRRGTYTGNAKMTAGNTNLDFFTTAWFNDVSVSPANALHWDTLFVSVPGLATTWENKREASKVLLFWNFTAICGNNATAAKQVGGHDAAAPNRGFRFVLNINGHIVDELDFRGPESNSSMVPLDYSLNLTSSDSPETIGHYYNAEALAPDLHHFTGWIVVDSTFLSDMGTKDADVYHSKSGGGAVAEWLEPLTAGASPLTSGWHNAGIQIVAHDDALKRIRIMSRRFGCVPFYW